MAEILDRRKYLGGSDAAAILGVSQWRTPLQVYYQKIGAPMPKDLQIDPARAKMFRRGKLMEPVVIRMLQDERPIKVTRKSSAATPNRYKDLDPACDFLAAEIDFEFKVTLDLVNSFAEDGVHIDPLLIGTIQNGEVKSAHPFVAMKKFGEEGTDEIPIDYAAQAMWGLMITGRQLCCFPVLVGSDDLVIYWVKRDEELIAAMRAGAIKFWHENVLQQIPPDPIRLPDIFSLLRKTGMVTKEADEATLELIGKYDEALKQAKLAEEVIEDLKFQLGEFLLGPGVMTTENPNVTAEHVITKEGKPHMTVSFQQQYRLSETQVKVRHPKVAEECVTLIQFFQFKRNRPRKS